MYRILAVIMALVVPMELAVNAADVETQIVGVKGSSYEAGRLKDVIIFFKIIAGAEKKALYYDHKYIVLQYSTDDGGLLEAEVKMDRRRYYYTTVHYASKFSYRLRISPTDSDQGSEIVTHVQTYTMPEHPARMGTFERYALLIGGAVGTAVILAVLGLADSGTIKPGKPGTRKP